MSRCQGRPQGRPEGTEARHRPLTTTGDIIKHNGDCPPARAGLPANAPHEVCTVPGSTGRVVIVEGVDWPERGARSIGHRFHL